MEQRQVTRHSLQVPAHVETMLHGDNVQSYEWKTRDVSSCGAFLLTAGQSLENGTDLKVSLHLDSFADSGSWITMNGRVVRTDSEGIGIRFDS